MFMVTIGIEPPVGGMAEIIAKINILIYMRILQFIA